MYTQALNMLLPYLLSWRTRLARADAAEQSPSPVKACASPARAEGQVVPPSSHAAGAAAGAAASAAQSPPATLQAAGQQQPRQPASHPLPPREQLDLQRLTAAQRHHLAVLLDTALLKVRLSSLHGFPVRSSRFSTHHQAAQLGAALQGVPTRSRSRPCPG
jgi:hypothetical protein